MKIRQILNIAATLAFAGFIATGCGNSVAKDAFCNVNGTNIKKAELTRIIDQAKKSYTQQRQKFPKEGTAEFKQLRSGSVDYLIEQELYRQQADKLDISIKKKDINDRLKQLQQNFFKDDKKAYEKALKEQGLTEEKVKANIEQQLLTEKLFEKVTKEVKVSESKAKQQFDENPSQYEVPEQRDVAHILVKTKKEADAIYAQVKGGDEKVFAKLAKEKSQDPSSAQNDGKLTISRGQTVPEFDKTAFELKTGAISAPVKTQFGYHVIAARGDIKPKRKKTFKEVKTEIIATLEQEQRSDRMTKWRQSIRKKAEKDVTCKKGYSWTQTVKSTESTPAPAPAPTDSGSKGKDKAKDDKKAADSSKDETKSDN